MTSLLNPFPVGPGALSNSADPTATDVLIDAAGEYVDFIGYVYWDGDAASKVVSTSGGAIVWRVGTSITFANAGTTMRVGIQDVDAVNGAPGRGDGTDDVYAEFVGGTDTITASTTREDAMETGTKTIAAGDLIAVRFQLTARAGADAVRVIGITTSSWNVHPNSTQNTASPAALSTANPNFLLKADDGTYGWLFGCGFCEAVNIRQFDSGTTPDEYASLVQWPFELAISGLFFQGRCEGSTSQNIRCRLYSAPLGTPVAERTTTIDNNQIGALSTGNNTISYIAFTSAYTVPANTQIALAIQPQSATADTRVYGLQIGSNAGARKAWRGLGGTWSEGTRSNDAGAFTEVTTNVMIIGALISSITTSGAGGGGVRNPLRGPIG